MKMSTISLIEVRHEAIGEKFAGKYLCGLSLLKKRLLTVTVENRQLEQSFKNSIFENRTKIKLSSFSNIFSLFLTFFL